MSVSQGEQENKKYMEYFNAKMNHFCYLRIKDLTVLLTSSPRLFGTFFEICSHFVTLFSDKKVLNILFDVEKDVYSVSDTSSSEEKNQVLPIGAEPMTFCLLLQRLYHSAQETDQWRVHTFR